MHGYDYKVLNMGYSLASQLPQSQKNGSGDFAYNELFLIKCHIHVPLLQTVP